MSVLPFPRERAHSFALAIHGGAGNISSEIVSPEHERECRTVLAQVLELGYALLQNGGSSLDVVEATVRMLEDSPLFNAGKGAALTHENTAELDAAIMDGRTLQAGSIAGVTTIRNPISAARAVLEKSPHVLLIGAGVEIFAKENGVELIDNSYFVTQRQIERVEKAKSRPLPTKSEKYGTVGAVALDQFGNLAAATSTGGMVNKRYGRVGDSPIIGAGTYANNATCAISATGHGEHFICSVVAYDISALMEYKGLSLQEATEEVVFRKLVQRNGDGGVIAIDNMGNIVISFNTEGMYRGSITDQGQAMVELFK